MANATTEIEKVKKLRDALTAIRDVEVAPVESLIGVGPVDMPDEVKPWCAALGHCVSVATAALSEEETQ